MKNTILFLFFCLTAATSVVSASDFADEALIFSGNSNPKLAKEVASYLDVALGNASVTRFNDGEIRIRINDNIRGRDVYIIHSTCSTDKQSINDSIMELFLMIRTMTRASAGRITAVIPYYGYARQDCKQEPRVPISAADIALLLEQAGVDRVVAVDLHCGQIQGFFHDAPVDNLYAAITFVPYFIGKSLEDIVVVSPDAGGVLRAKQFVTKLASYGTRSNLAIIVKQRAEAGVVETMNLIVNYRGYQVVSNPSPSFGGPIICEALEILSNQQFKGKDPVTKAIMRTEILQTINHLKGGAGGTTHMNVIDGNNNAVAMSLSAGTGCGYFYPNTGILLNNTMGEADLHPEAFYASLPGSRVSSMMAPTFIKKEGKVFASLGTGGSSRIRSAILQVILNLIDEGMDVKEAVEAPRLHFDEYEKLQIEPSFSKEILATLMGTFPNHNLWSKKDLYFGGVHTVLGNLDGTGDSRRNGSFSSLK